jgi:hypothetical protein
MGYMGYPIYRYTGIWGIGAMPHMQVLQLMGLPMVYAYAYAAPGQPLDLGVAPFGATPDTPYPHMDPQMGHPIQRARA